jgi:hypothetical protein
MPQQKLDEAAGAGNARPSGITGGITRANLMVARAEGLAEVEANGKAEAIIAVLQSRGIEVPDEYATRVLLITDQLVLDRLLDRVTSITDARELFGR